MRALVRDRPLVGSALVGLLAFIGFTGVCLAAGENVADSVILGAYLGLGTGGALALRYFMSRGKARR